MRLGLGYISDATDNKYEKNVPGVGGWGGTCKCPDGMTYEVGDNGDGCGSIACVNGEQIGECRRDLGEWSHRKVTCAGIL